MCCDSNNSKHSLINCTKAPSLFLIFFAVFVNQIILKNVPVFAHISEKSDSNSNPYRNFLDLGGNGKYLLEWEVDWEENKTVFSVTVKTRGYVGFGLNKKGKMDGADIVMGGVLSNGQPYFNDRHGIGNEAPVEDPSQDWTLHKAWENSSHTFLSFSRSFETCDAEHDQTIHDNSLSLIWAYGERDDDLLYHFENRGSQPVYLLDPEILPRKVIPYEWTPDSKLTDKNIQIWSISDSLVIPAKPTTYLCSIHKFRSGRKRHIIGFNPLFFTELARKHIHHFILFRCNLPPNQNPEKILEPLLDIKEECYILPQPNGQIPTNNCTEMYYVWALGDVSFFLPEHVGLPTGESEKEYFMLQAHFNNPDEVPGIRADYGLEIFTTDKLREHDAGVLTVGNVFPASPGIMIPPNSLGHEIYGHCGSECTKLMIPPEGINVFAANLHTHGSGRKLQMVHVRSNTELKSVASDDNYFPTYQKTRLLREESLVLPGDQLIMNCVYESTEKNGTVTVGGFHAIHEMCIGALYYYNKIPNRSLCGSEMRSDEYRDFLKIYNTTWSNEKLEMVVTSTTENFGLTVSEVGNQINWTSEKRRKLQELHRYLPQITICPPLVPFAPFPLHIRKKAKDQDLTNTNMDLQNIQRRFIQTRIQSEREKLVKRSNYRHYNNRSKIVSSALSNLNDLYKKDILFPEFEFVSVYERNVKPYQQTSAQKTCLNKNPYNI